MGPLFLKLNGGCNEKYRVQDTIDAHVGQCPYEKKNPNEQYHMYLNLLKDTVLAEWWEPPGFQAWFYKPYRDIVNKKMEELEEDEAVAAAGRGGRKKKKEKGLEILVPVGNKNWNTAKIVLGVTFVGYFGFVLGRRSR